MKNIKINPEVEVVVSAREELMKKKLKRVKLGNPWPKGSAARYRWNALFKSEKQGQSAWDYISVSGRPDTLRNAMRRGYIELV